MFASSPQTYKGIGIVPKCVIVNSQRTDDVILESHRSAGEVITFTGQILNASRFTFGMVILIKEIVSDNTSQIPGRFRK
jgi:hypothetical protein